MIARRSLAAIVGRSIPCTGGIRWPRVAPMTTTRIRLATDNDWPDIYPFYAAIIAEGKTIAFPGGLTLEDARPWWMEQPPGQTVVAVAGDTIVGSAKMGPNRPGRGAHVATASFLVDPTHRNRGVGRALGLHMIDWARSQGFRGIQFNAVVEVNESAVHLWQSLGFDIVGSGALPLPGRGAGSAMVSRACRGHASARHRSRAPSGARGRPSPAEASPTANRHSWAW